MSLLIAACGPSTSTDGDDSSSGASDATDGSDADDGADGNDAPDGDGDTSDDSNGTDGNTGPGCGLSDDPSSTVSMPVTVRNDSSVDRYLIPYPTYVCNYAIATIASSNGPLHWDDGSAYPLTCDSLCGWGCSDGPVGAVVLAPGAEWTFTWTGDYYVEAAVGAECVGEFECAEETSMCELRRAFGSGDVTVTVGTSPDCPDLIDGCACEGACEVTGYDLELPTITEEFSAELTFPEGGTVVLTD